MYSPVLVYGGSFAISDHPNFMLSIPMTRSYNAMTSSVFVDVEFRVLRKKMSEAKRTAESMASDIASFTSKCKADFD